MIDANKIDINWIDKMSKKHKADKILMEKAMRAFVLLEGLCKSGLPFVFKGGTSLLLHFEPPKRVSIDIDIIVPGTIDNIEEYLDKVVETQSFNRIEYQERQTNSSIKKLHCKFYYTPAYQTKSDADCVLLDILFEDNLYSNIERLPINPSILPTIDEPATVSVPSVEDLLGDKLTAFAPNTTGIPYEKHGNSMSMEIIKQLFDIGCLFDKSDNLQTIINTFNNIARAELGYRGTGSAVDDVLDDIFETSLCISTHGRMGKGKFSDLTDGIARIKGFIISGSYYIDNAILSAAKAAYMSSLIRKNKTKIEKFKNVAEIKDWTIESTNYNKLNKLKKTNQEAFFYWYKAVSE